jgi:cysteinyl-tRNA synthetase
MSDNKQFSVYNSLTRKKEIFKPIIEGHVGMYVCGPTVYGDPHLGHARPGITFDVLFRYLKYLDYKVRYVRNITDVGHLENDADEGEDKIAKKARLEQLEPMEIVQYYTDRYHKFSDELNILKPSIEPRASAHIMEQIEMIEDIDKNGFAYEVNGSVYFDVVEYNKKYNYGKLSGRNIEDLLENTRKLEGQDDKKSGIDFALWKKAKPEHIMRWKSKWSDGFPGWHLECSAMSTKYLGEEFDIHGGGLDLQFPHHECEIAQSTAANGKESVHYWMHNNMITINGQKMGKSLGNFITLEELFTGNHKLLVQSYSPMTIRFFILQAHYRSTVDFSNEALQAAEKGMQKLFKAIETCDKLPISDKSSIEINTIIQGFFDAINDDLNTPIAISKLFDGTKLINSVYAQTETLSSDDIEILKKFYQDAVFNILGLKKEQSLSNDNKVLDDVVDLILNLRLEAKANKDFALSDKIRNRLTEFGFEIKDKKDGFEWNLKEE